MKRFLFGLFLVFGLAGSLLAQQEKVDVFPAVVYDQYIIYQTLIIFWVGIIGLLVILRMKLREIEHNQEMGLHKEEKDTPLLD